MFAIYTSRHPSFVPVGFCLRIVMLVLYMQAGGAWSVWLEFEVLSIMPYQRVVIGDYIRCSIGSLHSRMFNNFEPAVINTAMPGYLRCNQIATSMFRNRGRSSRRDNPSSIHERACSRWEVEGQESAAQPSFALRQRTNAGVFQTWELCDRPQGLSHGTHSFGMIVR